MLLNCLATNSNNWHNFSFLKILIVYVSKTSSKMLPFWSFIIYFNNFSVNGSLFLLFLFMNLYFLTIIVLLYIIVWYTCISIRNKRHCLMKIKIIWWVGCLIYDSLQLVFIIRIVGVNKLLPQFYCFLLLTVQQYPQAVVLCLTKQE